LAGCQQEGTAEKVGKKVDQAAESAGKKVEKAGEAVVEKVEKTGDYMDDPAITAKVKAEILSDPLLKVSQISGRRLTKATEESKRTEAELRSIGAGLRETGEASALPDDKRDGRRIIGAALDQVIAKWLLLCWQNMRMTLVAHTNFLISPILALLLCMPKYVAGTMTLGDVIQAAAAFVLVQSAFNWITDSYVSIAEWTSSANRVGIPACCDRSNRAPEIAVSVPQSIEVPPNVEATPIVSPFSKTLSYSSNLALLM
jgi:hypothetical protein